VAAIQIAIGQILDAIKELIISKLAEFLAPIFGGMDNARAVIENVWNGIATFLSNVWAGIQVVARAGLGSHPGRDYVGGRGLAHEPGRGLPALVGRHWRRVGDRQDGGATAWATIKTTVVNVANTLGPALATAWESIRTGAATAWENIRTGAGQPGRTSRAASRPWSITWPD